MILNEVSNVAAQPVVQPGVDGHAAVPQNNEDASQNKSFEDIFLEKYTEVVKQKAADSNEKGSQGNGEQTPETRSPETRSPETMSQETNFHEAKSQDVKLQDTQTSKGGSSKKYEAMDYWNKKQTDFFNSLDDNMKGNVLDFINDNQKIYEHVTNTYKRDYTAMQDMLEPLVGDLRAHMDASTIEPAYVKQYIAGLLNLNRMVKEDPALAIASIAETFNVSQEAADDAYQRFASGKTADKRIEPVANRMSQQINQLNDRLAEHEEQRYVQELTGLYSKLSSEKNQDGSPKYKYLDKIGLEDFALILENVGLEGFDKGYESYIWAAPDIRAEMTQGAQQPASKPQDAKPQDGKAAPSQQLTKGVLPTSGPANSGLVINAGSGKQPTKSIDEAFYEAVAKYGF